VRYPGAVRDPDTGAWISDAEVAEIPYTAFASTNAPVTARLIVRRIKDARHPDALFPVWRYHPFFTNSTEPVTDADITHRRHAIIETTFADLIDGPLAHMPSGASAPTPHGFCARPSPTTCCAPPHRRPVHVTPSRAALPCAASSSTFPTAWPARNDAPSCTYPVIGPGPTHGFTCGPTSSATTHHR
jgi:hypothetical protein